MRRLPQTLALVAALSAGPAQAQVAGPVPPELEGVGIDQRLDAELPLDLVFDEDGRAVRLGSFFGGDRPVLLTLVYYRCPMLCTKVLDGLVRGLVPLEWTPGREFEIVTVSIDPRETKELARMKKQSYLGEYGRPGAAAGWHFLTGSQASIDALTDAVGFRYAWVPESGEFAHGAALVLLTPGGRVSRYLFGIEHDPRTLRLSLVEAAEGQIGGIVDSWLLYCYRYDPQTGRYVPLAWRIMRLGGILTVIVLGAVLAVFWRVESRRKRLA